MAGFLQEGTGVNSSTRLVTVGWCGVLFSSVLYCTYRNAALPIIPESHVMVTALFLGLKLGQKALGEKPTDPPKETP